MKFTKIFTMFIVITMVLAAVAITPSNLVQAANTTYYIDPSGNDLNNGTSTGTPWKTLGKVNGVTFQPGDRILFKAGGVWTGQLHPLGSGSSGSPIVIDQYGTGAKPKIDGNGSVGTSVDDYKAGAAVLLYNQNYWEINNLDVTNNAVTKAAYRYGFLIRWHNYGTGQHVYVKNSNIHDIAGDISQRFWSDGILVVATGSTTPTNFNDVRIENNTFTNINRTAISIWSAWSERNGLFYHNHPSYYVNTVGAWKPSTNVVVRNNALDTISGDGILVNTTTGALIEYNVVKDANKYNTDANVAIWPHNADNTVMQYNEAYNTRHTSDGQGYDVDFQCYNTILQYNYSHDNEGGFLLVMQNTGGTVVRYNISQNDKYRLLDLRTNSVNIYNNTFYLSGTTDLYRTSAGGGSYNNIYYSDTAGRSIGWGTMMYSNNSYFNLATTPTDTYKITADPKLVSPGNGIVGRGTPTGYKLQTTSPLINKGVYIASNGGKDYWGAVLDNVPDIGASDTITAGGTSPNFELPNLALGAIVTTSSSVENYGWFKTKVNDGERNSVSGARGYSSQLGQLTNHTEWVEINFGAIKTFSKVVLYSRNDSGMVGEGFPIDFKIQVWNGTAWLDRVVMTGYAKPGSAGQQFTWGSWDTTNKIRIYATNLRTVGSDGYLLQFAEIEVN